MATLWGKSLTMKRKKAQRDTNSFHKLSLNFLKVSALLLKVIVVRLSTLAEMMFLLLYLFIQCCNVPKNYQRPLVPHLKTSKIKKERKVGHLPSQLVSQLFTTYNRFGKPWN